MNNIYYLGPDGSFSQTIIKRAGQAYNEVACDNFSEIVEKTLADANSVGVLPIENSITSNIHENMDHLFSQNLVIKGEAFLKIHLSLFGLRGSNINDITKVYSQPQALSQCRGYIKSHNFITQETSSTAAAKNLILKMNDKRCAAIGSEELKVEENLAILESDIGDEKFNITRFVLVRAGVHASEQNDANKASVVFTIKHEAGALAKILTELGKASFNLTKIESRPIPASDWEYRFWIDIENKDNEAINEEKLNDILKSNTKKFKIAGIYPAGKIYE